MGNAGHHFICSYHAWQFNFDGSVHAIPSPKGYDETRFEKSDPDSCMKAAPALLVIAALFLLALPKMGLIWKHAQRC